MNPTNKIGMRIWRHMIMVLLWLIVMFLAARWVDNWRINKGYAELIPSSAVDILKSQSDLEIVVFAAPESVAANLVQNFLQPLLVNIKTSEVRYLDSSQNLELVKLYGIQKQGEMVIHQGDQNFQLSTLSYEAFFNGLKSLNHPKNKWIVFFDNFSSHDFKSGSGSANSYGQWLNQLLAVNYQAIVLDWQPNLKLPEQAQLLVLAAPKENLNEIQMQWLDGQILLGKSILWLTDPQYVAQQPALSLLFDVMRTDAYYDGQLVIKEYTDHVINQNFDRPLDLYEVLPFETANQILWQNEQGQPLAATQEITDQFDAAQASRLMVIGDSDFLSNQFIFSGGNLEMSFRLVDWLIHHDDRIDLPSIGLADTQVHLSASEILWFAGIMLLLIPGLFLIMAIYYWRKQKVK